MDLTTSYMGLQLACPLVVSACPLSRDLQTVRQLEQAGAGAIVLFSLFEEQVVRGEIVDGGWQALGDGSPDIADGEFCIDPQGYLDHIRRAKQAVDIPIIASLNVGSRGRWKQYAHLMEEAGADAIELDLYRIAAEPTIDSLTIEDIYRDIVADVKATVSVPVAVKLAPYFTALATIAARLDEAGADALVLFNRFYQPSIDIERRRLVMNLDLSSPADARLPLMWTALLKGQVNASLGASGGVHSAADAIRMTMAGADCIMLCSTLLRNGVEQLTTIRRDMETWLETHGHDRVDDIRGVLSRVRLGGSSDYLRAGYAKVLARYW